jgi:hypothetical protein
VELLVHYAPAIERWKIIAIIQPETNLTKYENGTDKPLEYYGITLRISEMYFTPLENIEKPTDLGIKILLEIYYQQRQSKTSRSRLCPYRTHNWRKIICHDIAFIEIGQLEGDHVN